MDWPMFKSGQVRPNLSGIDGLNGLWVEPWDIRARDGVQPRHSGMLLQQGDTDADNRAAVDPAWTGWGLRHGVLREDRRIAARRDGAGRPRGCGRRRRGCVGVGWHRVDETTRAGGAGRFLDDCGAGVARDAAGRGGMVRPGMVGWGTTRYLGGRGLRGRPVLHGQGDRAGRRGPRGDFHACAVGGVADSQHGRGGTGEFGTRSRSDADGGELGVAGRDHGKLPAWHHRRPDRRLDRHTGPRHTGSHQGDAR